jgi:class 3 adenylate cyclase
MSLGKPSIFCPGLVTGCLFPTSKTKESFTLSSTVDTFRPMSENPSHDARFQIGHVLFMDIVGYSKLLVNDQTRCVRQLNEVVQATEPFRAAERKNKLLRLATGDGMALVFRDSPESPVRCAVEISQALRKLTPPLPIRMGVHSGLVHRVIDVNNRHNVAGAGINIAQRVMDCGDAGHILLSKHVAEDLEHHARWQPVLHDLGQWQVKHGLRVGLVNLYDGESGNPQLPETIRRQRKKRRASSVFLFASTAVLSLLVAGGSWFLFTRFPRTVPPIQANSDSAPPGNATLASPPPTAQPGITLAQTDANGFTWPATPHFSPVPRQEKLFAGKWRGPIHNIGPQTAWDSQLELVIDSTETHWSNMTGGSVTRRGRTLSYRRSYKLGSRTNVQIHADLVLNDDDKTANYRSSQVSVTGKVRSRTFGSGTLEKVE